MMQKKVIYLLLIVLILTGCSSEKETFDTIYVTGSIASTNTYSDVGILNTERGILYYFDPETGIRTPLCSKVNCKHVGYGFNNPNPTCDAFFSEAYNCSAIVGDYLYYVTSDEGDGFFTKCFYRADKNGTNRKLLYRANYAEYFSAGVYEEGYLMYLYYNGENPDGTPLKKRKMGILLLNLTTEEMQEIDFGEEYSGQLLTATIKDNTIYCLKVYQTDNIMDIDYNALTELEKYNYAMSIQKKEVWQYDIKSGEKSLTCKVSSESSSCILQYGYLFCDYADKMTLQELGTDRIYVIEEVASEGFSKTVFDEGVLFAGNGEVFIWKFGTQELKKIGKYDPSVKILLIWVTKHWVYGNLSDTEGITAVCYPREDFMKGIFDYKEMNILNN